MSSCLLTTNARMHPRYETIFLNNLILVLAMTVSYDSTINNNNANKNHKLNTEQSIDSLFR